MAQNRLLGRGQKILREAEETDRGEDETSHTTTGRP